MAQYSIDDAQVLAVLKTSLSTADAHRTVGMIKLTSVVEDAS